MVYFQDLKSRSTGYFTSRWLAVYGYLLIVLIATPYLPLLIQWASLRWPAESISGFVLGVEISIGIFLIVSAGVIFFYNRRKFPSFVLIIGGLIAFASLFYLIIPNPYELTHLPEYAILGILILHAVKGKDGRRREKVNESYFYPVREKKLHRLWRGVTFTDRVYFRSAMITGVLGTIDELYQGILPLRYFTWYDVFLNGIGGLSGGLKESEGQVSYFCSLFGLCPQAVLISFHRCYQSRRSIVHPPGEGNLLWPVELYSRLWNGISIELLHLYRGRIRRRKGLGHCGEVGFASLWHAHPDSPLPPFERIFQKADCPFGVSCVCPHSRFCGQERGCGARSRVLVLLGLWPLFLRGTDWQEKPPLSHLEQHFAAYGGLGKD